MHSSLPDFVQWIAALGTPIIGVAVAAIAFRQWQTAREKLVLDLFDKRFKVFMALRAFISEAAQTGRSSGVGNEVVAEARFLFPEEIVSEITELVQLPLRINTEAKMLQVDLVAELERVTALLYPYMRMRQKLQ